jgi:uncharacterized membrane protein
MNCNYSTFLNNLFNFWFNNETPIVGKHIIFAFTTLIVALVIVILNYILIKTKNIDIIKLEPNKDENSTNTIFKYFLWVCGSFLISFILTTTEIINITLISSVLVGFTWDKLFIQLSKIYNNENINPNTLTNEENN